MGRVPSPRRPVPSASTLRLLERLAVAVLLLAAAVPRALDLGTGFDREFEGWQGAFLGIAAVNYERFGPLAFGGYPALVVDLQAPDSTQEPLSAADALVYTNHPPTAALLAWGSARLLGPAGWADAWRRGEAPEGLEPALRLPFLLAHLLGLCAFYWALRQGSGPGLAMIALALLATAPVSLLYGFLASYENPSLPCVFLAVGFGARFIRGGARRDLLGTALALFAGASVTYAPAFFLPPLVLVAWRRTRRRALALAAAGLPALLLPLAAHALLAPAGLGSGGSGRAPLLSRVRELWAPLLDGSRGIGEWAAAQVAHATDALGLPLALAAAAGALLSLARAAVPRLDAGLGRGEVRSGAEARDPIPVGAILSLGAGLYLFAFYRHTLEPQRPFQLFVAPAAAACAAALLAPLAKPLFRFRAGIAPLVLVVAAIALPGVAHFESLRAAARAPLAEGQPGLPLPQATGEALAQVVPRGALGLIPGALGLNLAPTYYAWRNVLAVPDPTQRPALLEASRVLARAPTYAALPDQAPPAAQAALAALREQLEARAPAQHAAAGWSAWRLDG